MEHGLPFADSMLFQGCCLYSNAERILQRIDIDCFLNIGNLILFNRADGGEEIALPAADRNQDNNPKPHNRTEQRTDEFRSRS